MGAPVTLVDSNGKAVVLPSSTDASNANLPANFDSLPEILTYNVDGTVATIAKTNGTNTWTQTLTYGSSGGSTGRVTTISAWVKT